MPADTSHLPRPVTDAPRLSDFGFGDGRDVGDVAAAAYVIADEIKRNPDTFIPPVDGTVWTGYSQMHRPYLEGFLANDPAYVKSICGHLFATPLTNGYAQGHEDYAGLSGSEGSRLHVGRIIIDKLLRLGEAFGLLPVHSPEHNPTKVRSVDLAHLFNQIEEHVGVDLTPPKVNGGLFGISLNGRYFSERHFEAIYIAKRVRDLGAESIIEIGGGAAYVAYYCRKFGVKTHTIVDIPTVSLIQYLILSQEFEDVSFGTTGSSINLIPTYAMDSVDWKGATLVLNVDSLPEIPPAQAINYLKLAERTGRLLSLNQESESSYGINIQPVVHRLVATHTELKRKSRFPHWMRAGYVDELFEA